MIGNPFRSKNPTPSRLRVGAALKSMRAVAARLRQARVDAGMDTATLAARLLVSEESLRMYEAGQANPNVDVLIAWANIFELTVDIKVS